MSSFTGVRYRGTGDDYERLAGNESQTYAPVDQEMLLPEDLETYIPLEEKLYDVTNYIESGFLMCMCPFLGWMSKSLYLDDQEAVFKISNCCGSMIERRPYAQLGSVDKLTKLGVCVVMSSDLARVNEKGEGGISPGFGCSGELVEELVQVLQHRKLIRGNVAQMRKLDYLYHKIVQLAQQLPEVLGGLGVSYTPKVKPIVEGVATFEHKEYDITNNYELLLGCVRKTLTLKQDEAELKVEQCMGCMESFTSKREYAQLHHVDLLRQCFCCRATNSGLGVFSPGFGCETQTVSEITEELKTRMYARGTIGQIRKQEKMMKQMAEIASQISLLQTHLGIQYPPEDDVLERILGGQLPASLPTAGGLMEDVYNQTQLADLDQQVTNKSYDITNNCEALAGLLCTCGLLGWTSKTLELGTDETVVTEVNNCGSLTVKTPYAQMGFVDFERQCFCCYHVNMACPGWGCSKALVEDLAQELQARKVKRGNIAQVQQLEKMQHVSLEVDIKTDLILASEQVPYPPGVETVARVYGASAPLILSRPPTPPHVSPGSRFPHKQYDVSNHCLSCCLCASLCGMPGPCTRIALELEAEEMYVRTTNWLSQTNRRTPYAHLGSVDTLTFCLCCSSLPEVATPGCGCSRAMVAEIAGELQERKVKRGNIAQIKLQENIMNEVLKTGVKVDLLLDRLRTRAPKP